MLINLLGFTASIISFIMWLPQAKITWNNRHSPALLTSISEGTQFLVMVNATIWAVYAIATESYWTGAPGLVNLPLALLTLMLIRRAKRQLKKAALDAETLKLAA